MKIIINIFYISVALVAGILYYVLVSNANNDEISFYGFSESNETKINYNYPVIIDSLLISPGEQVMAGDTLMHITRKKSKETLSSQSYRIDQLKAEQKIWLQKKNNDVEEIITRQTASLKQIDAEISQIESEIKFKASLSEGLKSIEIKEVDYRPLNEKIEELKIERNNINAIANKKIENLKNEIALGNSPFKPQINKLNADIVFEESQKEIKIFLTAPSDGLIGSIGCKEKEHISSFETLLTIYEPHSGLIRGYVHENLTLEVKENDQFKVASLKDPNINYIGTVTGLGSRIIEIPNRLRKNPTFKTYGREVLINISKDNEFLQKEKVSLIRVK